MPTEPTTPATEPSPASERSLVGRVVVYGDDVDTDQIIPARYLVTVDAIELGRHCMADSPKPLAAALVPSVDPSAGAALFIVAGRNFGCGSSREHAPLALLGANVRAVLADSFARIFFRNAINVGLTVVECPGLAATLEDGDVLAVDVDAGTVRDLARDARHACTPLPPSVVDIVAAGGLVARAREQLAIRG
jgi:3-isopropylmalate dehydratase small subunit